MGNKDSQRLPAVNRRGSSQNATSSSPAPRPQTSPNLDGLYRKAKMSSRFSSVSEQSAEKGPSKTQRLLERYNRPWRPRTATMGEVTAAANRQSATLHSAIVQGHLPGRSSLRTSLAGGAAASMRDVSDDVIRSIESRFDATMSQLQDVLAAEKNSFLTPAAPKSSVEEPKPIPHARPNMRQKKAPEVKRKEVDLFAQEEAVLARDTQDESRMSTGKRLQKKIGTLRANPDQAYKLHRNVAHERALSASGGGKNGRSGVNHIRVNRLTLKVMASMPLPGGDACDYDYSIRAKSPPHSPPARPSTRGASSRSRSVPPTKLLQWQEEVQGHVTQGGAPYPRGVVLSHLQDRSSARRRHREEVIHRRDLEKQRSQSARELAATRHDRRVADSAQQKKDQAEKEVRLFRQHTMMSVCGMAMVFNDIREHILARREQRVQAELRQKAVMCIIHWWGKKQFQKRQVGNVGFFLRLTTMMRPWVTRARERVRKRHAALVLTVVEKMTESNQVVVALRTFRERVLTIQRYWRAAIAGRNSKLQLLYLQWLRYETNLIKERKRQDAEYEKKLQRELALMHPSKRKAAAMKSSRDGMKAAVMQGVVKEKSEDLVDVGEISAVLRDEDIHAAIAASKNQVRSISHAVGEADEAAEVVEFKPQRRIKSDTPGEDGLHLNYQMLKKLGVKALRHGISPAEAQQKKEEEEEEDYKNRRVPRDIKLVINQIMYNRAKHQFYRDQATYQQDMVHYNSNAPFEETRLELFRKAGLPVVSRLVKPKKPYVKIMLDKKTLAFMHSKGVRMMQVREAEEKQRQADLEALMADQLEQ